MNLYEYQVKDILSKAGFTVPKSKLVRSISEANTALQMVHFPCVLKSQTLSGGRGKAGLIKFVNDQESALNEIQRLFQHPLNIPCILIETAVDFVQEVYVSFTFDPVTGNAISIVSAVGGVEIENLAIEYPDKIIKTQIDMRNGLMSYQANHIAYECGFNIIIAKKFAIFLQHLYNVFIQRDCELLEVNPLFITSIGELVIGDGKCSIDGNSLFRHPDLQATASVFESEASQLANEEGIPFIQFDGDIGLMCAGAGLTTVVYDLINYEGGSVANYLEFGGPNYKKALKAMEICLKVPSKVILIVTFGTIARADVMAQGIVDAITRLKPDRPIVVCIRGTNEEEATALLKSIGLNPLFDTEEAVKQAILLANKGVTT